MSWTAYLALDSLLWTVYLGLDSLAWTAFLEQLAFDGFP